MDVDYGKALSRCLAQVGRGRVATCGGIARALGDVRAARSVAAWLLEHRDTDRGHRVVRADGRPVLPEAGADLTDEGVRLAHGCVPRERILDGLEPVGFLTALREEQRKLSKRVIERDTTGQIERIAGADAAYEGDTMYAVAACIDSKDLTLVEIAAVRLEAAFPYIPTYLAFREFSGIEAAVRRLARQPDVLMVDGHGRLHPTLFGIACHAGVRLNLPTIGVAKHPLVGRLRPRRGPTPGGSPIEFHGGVRGYAWTPPGRARPIYISIGNRISLERAVDVVRGSTRLGYPEALRLADRICGEMKRNEKREKGVTR